VRVYVCAHSPELEKRAVSITEVLRWTGHWSGYRIEWSANAISAVEKPELCVIAMGGNGEIHIATPTGFAEEQVDSSTEGPGSRGMLRDLRYIGGHFYVAGMGRQVYRREGSNRWVRCDAGVVIPAKDAVIAGFNSIDGFSEQQIYAVGWGGEIWLFDGRAWSAVDSPTNMKLERVICVAPDTVYACGQSGLLLKGIRDKWEIVDHGGPRDQFWGMEWFQDKLWLATDDAVYCLQADNELKRVDFGPSDGAITCGWLHSGRGSLWSVGEEHLLSTTDGVRWTSYTVP
jgi:hypothetical protein